MKRAVLLWAALCLLLGTAFLGLQHRDLILEGLGRLAALGTPPWGAEREPVDLVEAPRDGAVNGTETAGAELPPSVEIKALAAQITEGAAGEYEKLVAIYDFVTHNFAYDLEKLKDIGAYGRGAEYLLLAGKGICHDFADLTLALLTAVGIEATYESGDVYPAPGKVERHAWNHARVDGKWYALDTTWGAGFILEEENLFIQSPRRLYLTTPQELNRLHRDPAYREEQEHLYRMERTRQAQAVYLPDYEERLVELFNAYRADRGLPPLRVEERIREAARQAAGRLAEGAAHGEEGSLEGLMRHLEQRTRELRLKSAAAYSYLRWSLIPADAGELYTQIINEQRDHLERKDFQAIAVAVVRKGDLTVVVHAYLEQY